MVATIQIPNERPLVRAYAAVEPARGTFEDPNFKLYADLRITDSRPLATDKQEYSGTFFGDIEAARGAAEIAGTVNQRLSYEDYPLWLRTSVKGGGTGVTDGNTVPGYTHTKRPSPVIDDLDTFSIEYGYEGMPFECTMIQLHDFTIAANIDDAAAEWMLTGNLIGRSKQLKGLYESTATSATATTLTRTGATWGVNAYQDGWIEILEGTGKGQTRSIASNTATVITVDTAFSPTPDATSKFAIVKPFTAAIPERDRDMIKAPGTKLYLDGDAAFGTNQVRQRFSSFSVTYDSATNTKRYMEDVDTVSARLGRGFVVVTGQVRLEFDHMYEYLQWKNFTPTKIKIIQDQGPIIDATAGTRKKAWINVYTGYWDSMPDDDRVNNVMVTAQFRGYLDQTELVPVEFGAINQLSALPS